MKHFLMLNMRTSVLKYIIWLHVSFFNATVWKVRIALWKQEIEVTDLMIQKAKRERAVKG